MIAQCILNYQDHNDQDILWKKIQAHFNIETIHPSVKSYLTKNDLFEGMLYINHAVEIKDTYYSYHQLVGDELEEEDSICPIVCIGGEVYGTYFWLVLTTGDVISVHHGSFGKMLHDVALMMQPKTTAACLQKMIELGSSLKIDQLLALQEASKEILDLESENEDAFQKILFARVAQILNLTETELYKQIDVLPLAFISSRCMDYVEEKRR